MERWKLLPWPSPEGELPDVATHQSLLTGQCEHWSKSKKGHKKQHYLPRYFVICIRGMDTECNIRNKHQRRCTGHVNMMKKAMKVGMSFSMDVTEKGEDSWAVEWMKYIHTSFPLLYGVGTCNSSPPPTPVIHISSNCFL